jgi:hypothetical protein
MAIETEKKHKCPPHHWIIDKDDVGWCIYCRTVKDFRKLQQKEARRLLRSYQRGAAASWRQAKYG